MRRESPPSGQPDVVERINPTCMRYLTALCQRDASKKFSRNPPHMYVSAWLAEFPDPFDFLGPHSWLKYSRWENEDYFSILEKAQSSLDHKKRMFLYSEAEHLIAKEIPVIPLLYMPDSVFIQPWVKRVARNIKNMILDPDLR